jgi:hypothetical protein
MSSLERLVVLAIGLAINWPGYADDLPFGADALRHLTNESKAVIRAADPRRLASDAARTDDPSLTPYATYSVRVAEVLKAEFPVKSDIRIALPEAFNVRSVNQLENAILFVRPFSEDDIKQSNIPPGGDVYLVVSGRYGAVDAAPANRKVAIQEYLESTRSPDAVLSEAIRGERTLTWTERHLDSADTFLQRSAIIDLFYERSRPRALEQLGRAVRSESVLPNLKNTAIQALEASGAAAAAQPLREIAEDEKVQKRLRESAVKAFQSLPGGADQLRRWSEAGDDVLSPAARSTIRNLQEHRR